MKIQCSWAFLAWVSWSWVHRDIQIPIRNGAHAIKPASWCAFGIAFLRRFCANASIAMVDKCVLCKSCMRRSTHTHTALAVLHIPRSRIVKLSDSQIFNKTFPDPVQTFKWSTSISCVGDANCRQTHVPTFGFLVKPYMPWAGINRAKQKHNMQKIKPELFYVP